MKNFNFYQLNHIIISNTLTEIKMNEILHFVSYPSYPNLSYENKKKSENEAIEKFSRFAEIYNHVYNIFSWINRTHDFGEVVRPDETSLIQVISARPQRMVSRTETTSFAATDTDRRVPRNSRKYTPPVWDSQHAKPHTAFFARPRDPLWTMDPSYGQSDSYGTTSVNSNLVRICFSIVWSSEEFLILSSRDHERYFRKRERERESVRACEREREREKRESQLVSLKI